MRQLQDLTLHVGLPKTGTTTLQREVFPEFRGYVCGTESSGPSGDLAQQMLRLYQVKGAHRDWNTDVWRSEAIAWWAQARATSNGPLLVSLEGLYRWFDPVTGTPWPLMGNGKYRSHRRGDHPLGSFLAALQTQFGDCRLRVALTLRNQSDFLASHYAQISYRLSNPSQKDFEAKVRHVITEFDPFFDWINALTQISSIVGAPNLQISVFENGLDSVARDISAFVDPNWVPAPIKMHHNARGQQETWTLTVPQRRGLRRLLNAIRFRNLVQTRESLRNQRGLNSTSARSVDTSHLIVPRALRVEIQHHFKHVNEELSYLIGKDLVNFGY